MKTHAGKVFALFALLMAFEAPAQQQSIFTIPRSAGMIEDSSGAKDGDADCSESGDAERLADSNQIQALIASGYSEEVAHLIECLS
ncbi:hypothetical protein AAG565_09085 [Fontimonas sp. SYSU GA230001]|uniref:hypothetical protein n=1 Tax=Fontimonas sp. SYSU GA230001 TaxID=3142450 RepID=UPI0032B364E9